MGFAVQKPDLYSLYIGEYISILDTLIFFDEGRNLESIPEDPLGMSGWDPG